MVGIWGGCDRLLVNATACESTMTLDSVTKEAEAACESTEEQKENARAEMRSAEEGGGGGSVGGQQAKESAGSRAHQELPVQVVLDRITDTVWKIRALTLAGRSTEGWGEGHDPKPQTGVLCHDPKMPSVILGHDLRPDLWYQLPRPGDLHSPRSYGSMTQTGHFFRVLAE